MSVINRALERLQGLVWGDGVKDSSVYIDDHTFYVDMLGRDASKPALVVRGLAPGTNAPTILLQLDKDGVLAPSTGNPIVNPGLEVWQRGAGPFTASAAFTADRWQIALNGTSTLSVSRDTANVDAGSLYCAALTHVQGSGTNYFVQLLEDYYQFRGRRITFSARVKTATPNAVRLSVFDAVTRTAGAYHSGSGAYETLSVTATFPMSAIEMQVEVQLPGASATVYVDNAAVTPGAAPAAYVPLTPSEDLARCQRYYEIHGGVTSGPPGVFGYGAASSSCGAPVSFAARKAVVPTLTKGGTWTVTNCGQPSTVAAPEGYLIFATVTALGAFNFCPNSADDTIVAEGNP